MPTTSDDGRVRVSTIGEVVDSMMETKPVFEPKRSVRPAAVGGVILIILGVLVLGLQFLAPNFLYEPIHLGATIGAAVFLIPALVFLAVLALNPRRNWWACFPAFPLASLGTLILVEANTGLTGLYAAPILLGGISLTFFAVLLLRRDHYWPVIPGGVLLSLAIDVRDPYSVGPGFLLGFGVTFLATFAVSLLMPRKAYWALIPAALFFAAGLGLTDMATLNWFAPGVLILLGVVMLVRRFRQ